MTGRLAGRVCLVTGSTGIAAASALRLAGEGAAVFVVSRTADHIDELVERVHGGGGQADGVAADLTVEADVASGVEACVNAYGQIDGLLSVAGGSGRSYGDGPVHELTVEGWDRTLELNLRNHALVSRAVVRQMLAQQPNGSGTRGSIVLVSSVLASYPVPELFATHAYAAAKGGIVSLAVAMAASYAASWIRVNVIEPGLTATPMAARAAADARTVAFARRKQPLVGGLLEPDEIAEAALFLLGDESRAVTGQVLAVDGGWSVVSAPVEGLTADSPGGEDRA
jgi:NAD(P)-dependent dehydrogenase (short-subunit alcohol dehydrogenase family)